MKDIIKCPITLGEFERMVKNKTIYNNLNEEQKAWIDYFMFTYEYKFYDFVLTYKDSNLIVITNTCNGVKEFKI